MPITIIPASHQALPFPKTLPATSPLNLLRTACPIECVPDTEILISSFKALKSSDNIVASSGSFLRGAIQAWSQHLHLVIRPEDIWFAILVQLNFYMAANAEKVRHLFVNHEGKQEIRLEADEMNKETLEYMLSQFSAELHDRIKTKWMYEWIIPSFSTTTDDDKMTANVLMMGLMQSYFTFFCCMTCGIPSVTLLGEKEDYTKLLDKLHRLTEFGDEPIEYAARLKPILTRFVRTFEEPDSEEIKDFWNHIVKANPQHRSGAPPYTISGWLMGFCYWNAKGEPKFDQPWRLQYRRGHMELDGIVYPILNITDIPVGYAKAPIKVKDWPAHHGTKYASSKEGFPGVVVAGAIGKRISPGAPTVYEGTSPDSDIEAGKDTDLVNTVAAHIVPRNSLGKRPVANEGLSEEHQQSFSTTPRLDAPAFEQQLSGEEQREDLDAMILRDQATLQPVSGWMLFGPEEKKGGISDPELDHLQSYLCEHQTWRRERGMRDENRWTLAPEEDTDL